MTSRKKLSHLLTIKEKEKEKDKQNESDKEKEKEKDGEKYNENSAENCAGGSNANDPTGKPAKRHAHHSISQLPMTTKKKLSHLLPRKHHRHRHATSIDGVSSAASQKNLKQRITALLRKFRTDGNEQYREALERELMKATAERGPIAIEELLDRDIDDEEEDDDEEFGSQPEDWDNISETSAPKPSLRPFFSSTTLDKI